MKAVILAAGEGVRMRPLTLTKPKPMLEVGGKPILHHIWESLPDEVDEVILVVGYKGDMIKKYFGNSFLGRKVYYVKQEEKLGTAHSLKLARSLLKDDEKFLVFYADDLHHKESIERLLDHDLALLVYDVPDPRRFGVIVTDDRGVVVDIEEKPEFPKSNLANVGVYILDNRIFDYEAEQHPNGEYYLSELVGQLIRDHKVFAEKTDFWFPIGYPEDLAMVEEVIYKRDNGE